MKRFIYLPLSFLLFLSTPASSQNWCCCQIGCIQDIFFVQCDAYCAAFGGGINWGTNIGYPDPTCGGLSCPPTVPVTLLSFEADILKNDRVLLQWKTETEVNNRGFEIHRSINGTNWETLGFQNGSGMTSKIIEYQFIDHSPPFGTVYYRLKQIDYDGKYTFSRVLSLKILSNKNKIGELYPNPSQSGLINLDYSYTENTMLTVSVFEISGKKLLSQKYSILEGNNTLRLDFSSLQSGIYIVTIFDGIILKNTKLIIE